MSRETRERLTDVLEAIEAICAYVGGELDAPSVEQPLVLDAVLFRLVVIGEAIKNVEAELKSTAPDVPWSDYAGLRDVIAHQYFRVHAQIIEDTVRNDLPRLRAAVERLTA